MLFNIVMGILAVILYALIVCAGYNRANDKLNDNEPHASIWETIERIYLAVLCVVFIMYLLSMEFDVVTYYLKDILEKLEVLTAHG